MGNLSLNIGLKALLTSQSQLDTIGHNLTNASTPGYSRQDLMISASSSQKLHGLIQGGGVQADVIKRTVDTLLNRRLGQQQSFLNRLETRLNGLSQMESVLGGGSTSNIGTLLSSFTDTLSRLASSPEDGLLRSTVVQSASELASRFQLVSEGVTSLRDDVLGTIRSQVEQVNVLADTIAATNLQISSLETAQLSANDLRDRRDLAISELSQLVDVRTVEDERGAVRVLVAGQVLVTPTGAKHLSVDPVGTGDLSLHISDGNGEAKITGGTIGGSLAALHESLPNLASGINKLAHNLILEMNRAHSTGVPAGGPFRALSGTNALLDQNGNGVVTDELLSRAGLPFDVGSGELYVNVTDLATGEWTGHRIAIDAELTRVSDLLAELNQIPGIDASVDARGQMQIAGESGFGFDFGARLDANPDDARSFGGMQASLGTGPGPFALGQGDTLDFTTSTGPVSVAFDAADFAQIGAATADEIAAVLQADAGFQASGLTASAVGGRLVVQTVAAGATANYTLNGGTAAGALGWNANTVVTGQDHAVGAKITGAYTGPANDGWTFHPMSDGTIGTTPGLQVEVLDQRGQRVALLDVGPGYIPGEPIDVAHGVQVAFNLGAISATDGDAFHMSVIADSDSSDLLPALGLNTLFTGSDATDIEVRAALENDPDLLATSSSGTTSDAGAVLALIATTQSGAAGLDDRSFSESFAEMVGSLGSEIDSTRNAHESESLVHESLVARQAQVSGVNTDEELAKMITAQQAYSAAGQFIRVISDLNAVLMSLI